MVQSGESVWELGLAAPLRVTHTLGVDKINVCFLDALIEGTVFIFSLGKEEKEEKAGQGSSFCSSLWLSCQETSANAVGKDIGCCRNWPATNDCSHVGVGKEVWRLITFNGITLDLEQGM